jgi:hypothetical protein
MHRQEGLQVPDQHLLHRLLHWRGCQQLSIVHDESPHVGRGGSAAGSAQLLGSCLLACLPLHELEQAADLGARRCIRQDQGGSGARQLIQAMLSGPRGCCAEQVQQHQGPLAGRQLQAQHAIARPGSVVRCNPLIQHSR